MSGSWQRECEAGVVGRNVTQNRPKAAGPQAPVVGSLVNLSATCL